MNQQNTIRVELPITGMTCGGCARQVDRGLSAVPGVRDVEIDRLRNRAIIVVERGTPHVALIDAVRGAGFAAGEPLGVAEDSTESGCCG